MYSCISRIPNYKIHESQNPESWDSNKPERGMSGVRGRGGGRASPIPKIRLRGFGGEAGIQESKISKLMNPIIQNIGIRESQIPEIRDPEFRDSRIPKSRNSRFMNPKIREVGIHDESTMI